jgi:hypothetical protein
VLYSFRIGLRNLGRDTQRNKKIHDDPVTGSGSFGQRLSGVGEKHSAIGPPRGQPLTLQARAADRRGCRDLAPHEQKRMGSMASGTGSSNLPMLAGEGVDWQNLMVLIYGKQGARRLRGRRQHSDWRNSGHFRRRARPTPSAAEAAT